MLGPTTREQQDALWDYGLNIGMAFQIVDDLLDFTGEEVVLGKPVGGDLREGKMTLPVIHLLARDERGGASSAGGDSNAADAGGVARASGTAGAASLDRLRARSRRDYVERAARRSMRFPPRIRATH
jgi:geranylgeranyl pyrophosphate synthase